MRSFHVTSYLMIRLLWVIFLMMPLTSIAQDTTQLFHQKQLLIKWNPLSLFDAESMVQVAGEYFLHPRSAIQAELGYGPPFLDKLSLFKQGALDYRQAWRFRAEYRHYRAMSKTGRYWAVEGFALTVNGPKTVFISDFDGGNNTPVAFPTHKRVLGAHLKAGVQRPLRRQGKSRWFYDFYAGLGLRSNHTVVESVDGIKYIHPIGGQFFDVYRPANKVEPSAVIGIKFSYQVR